MKSKLLGGLVLGLACSVVLAPRAQERAQPIVIPPNTARPLAIPVGDLQHFAGVRKIHITTKESSPTFGGYSWPGVGQYEKIVGKAFGELDPNDPKSTVIVDLQLAPRNANGHVEYSFDFYILKPMDLTKGNHKMLYEPPNRGGKTISALNRGVGGNDPGSVTDPTLLVNSFLMPQGYSISFSGWDLAAGTSTANFNTTITLPIAKNPDGSPITGPSYEYIVSPGASYALTYQAAALDQSKATLTHRVHLNDTPASGACLRLAVQRERDGDLAPACGHVVCAERYLRIQLYREGSDGQRCRLCGRSRLECMASLRHQG